MSGKMTVIDAAGKCVLPGFIDAHTHFVFAGERSEEFSWRLKGMRYIEIMERGGGIMNTVRATRKAGAAELAKLGRMRLNSMLAMGVTTVEGKKRLWPGSGDRNKAVSGYAGNAADSADRNHPDLSRRSCSTAGIQGARRRLH